MDQEGDVSLKRCLISFGQQTGTVVKEEKNILKILLQKLGYDLLKIAIKAFRQSCLHTILCLNLAPLHLFRLNDQSILPEAKLQRYILTFKSIF